MRFDSINQNFLLLLIGDKQENNVFLTHSVTTWKYVGLEPHTGNNSISKCND